MIKFEYGVLKISKREYLDLYEFNGDKLNNSIGDFNNIEYLNLHEILNLFGNIGWELCNFENNEYIFKRKID